MTRGKSLRTKYSKKIKSFFFLYFIPVTTLQCGSVCKKLKLNKAKDEQAYHLILCGPYYSKQFNIVLGRK